MKFRNIRIHKWRSYQNSWRSDEMKDVRNIGGCRAGRAYINHIPPKSDYEKWIIQNESSFFMKGKDRQISFRIIIYSLNEKNIQKIIKDLKRDFYSRYRIIFANTVEQGFEENTILGEENYVVILNADFQELAFNTLGRLADFLWKNPCDYVYSDQDEYDVLKKERKNPFFKPDWSPDTFCSFFYTGNISAYRMETCRRFFENGGGEKIVQGMRKEYGRNPSFAQYHYMFSQLFIENCMIIRHIPEILCHEVHPIVYVQPTKLLGEEMQISKAVQISSIILSKDHPEVLEQCINSIQKWELKDEIKSIYYEILVVDNGSSEDNRKEIIHLSEKYHFRYIYEPMPFNFSRMCNLGAQAASGEYLLFLNDDIEAREPGWIMKMYELASREHVGAVGAKLYYPESRKIQHIGVVNLDIGPGHYFLEQEDEGDLYFGRNIYDYNCLAVTAACMMIDRKKFEQVGGFDESFPVSYNDIDLCFSLYEQGYYNVVCNRTSLYHH